MTTNSSKLRLMAASIALSVAAIAPSQSLATPAWGADMSDLWWVPAESGWGASVSQQGDTIFLTLFVYGPDGKPKWYVASAMKNIGVGDYRFDGALYETSGPYLGGPFNPASVNARQIGTASLSFNSAGEGNLTYTIDGVTVTKPISRLTFGQNNLTGSYFGGAIGSTTGCGTSSASFANTAAYTINHDASNISITSAVPGGPSCTYSGKYTQDGKMASAEGTVSCSNGVRGSFSASEIEASRQGFFLRYSTDRGGGCKETGRLGGLKR